MDEKTTTTVRVVDSRKTEIQLRELPRTEPILAVAAEYEREEEVKEEGQQQEKGEEVEKRGREKKEE